MTRDRLTWPKRTPRPGLVLLVVAWLLAACEPTPTAPTPPKPRTPLLAAPTPLVADDGTPAHLPG